MRQFPLFFIIAEMNAFGKKGDGKGKEVGVMTLYDVLLFMVLATGFILAINKK